jgi:hypothetical protein
MFGPTPTDEFGQTVQTTQLQDSRAVRNPEAIAFPVHRLIETMAGPDTTR